MGDEHTGIRPCPEGAWGPRAWPLQGVSVPAAAPVPSAAPVPAEHTLTLLRRESRSRPPQPPARAPPPQHGQQPRALSASGLGRAHRCARPFSAAAWAQGSRRRRLASAGARPLPGGRSHGGGACGGAMQPARGDRPRGTLATHRCARPRTRAPCCRENLCASCSSRPGAPGEPRSYLTSQRASLRSKLPGVKSSAQSS